MQKIIVVYKEPLSIGGGSQNAAKAIVEHLTTLPTRHCLGITAHIRTAEFPSASLPSGSFDLSIACGLSLWVPSFEDVDALAGALQVIGTPDGIYSVVESTPRDYPVIDWKDGTKSPGATLFAMFRRRDGIDSEGFLHLWQEHTVLSLQFHPLIKYHRNAVMRKLSGPGEDWEGIVEERVGSLADLAPENWYMGEGTREKAVEHLISFVDIYEGGMRCGLLEEYIVRRPCWLR